jgi:EF hand
MRKTVLAVTIFAILLGPALADPVADFVASDINKDGLLQKAEFQAFVKRRAASGNAASKWVVRFGAWGRALATVDYNRDGQVSGDELRKYDKKS